MCVCVCVCFGRGYGPVVQTGYEMDKIYISAAEACC